MTTSPSPQHFKDLSAAKQEQDLTVSAKKSFKILFYPHWPNNPYQDLLITHLVQQGVSVQAVPSSNLWNAVRQERPDIIHFHALYHLFLSGNLLKSWLKAIYSLVYLLILRSRGTRIVWTAHDLKNHENRKLGVDRFFTKWFARLSHVIIAHAESAKREVMTVFKLHDDPRLVVIPHGNYIGHYPNQVERAQARQSLGLPEHEFVFLFLGLIRPYKGVPEMIHSFQQLNQTDCRLVIAGKLSEPQLEQEIQQRIGGNTQITLIPGFVPDDQIQTYMNAADVVVLPYRDILTSGSVVLAMSFGKACIAPRRGCIEDMLDDSGSFLYNPDDADGLVSAMQRAVEAKETVNDMGQHNLDIAEEWSWARVAQMTLEAYSQQIVPQ